ncbi:hypothetical protein CEP54_010599 [Fusarium duplospermum]|uniref:Uncharacterized protein n=1 Tax=Fusarium duplospermum TaxID=1325734 RepID=A0A428PJ79_9HYPO|nr:hypothetical protein CEP54_010599 [Fusarium duplospermum]
MEEDQQDFGINLLSGRWLVRGCGRWKERKARGYGGTRVHGSKYLRCRLLVPVPVRGMDHAVLQLPLGDLPNPVNSNAAEAGSWKRGLGYLPARPGPSE